MSPFKFHKSTPTTPHHRLPPNATPPAVTLKHQRFNWQAYTAQGELLRGEMLAYSDLEVRARLRKQQLTPKEIRLAPFQWLTIGQRITSKSLAIFSRQLSTMMGAGVALVQSLEMIARSHDNPRMRHLVETLQNDLENGATFSESLAKHPHYFNNLYVNLVAAGERSGTLELLLAKLAEYQEKHEALKAKVRKALVYPSAVVGVALVVMFILLYFVIPEFAILFQGFNAQLPTLTQQVINVANFLQANILSLSLGALLSVIGFIQSMRRSSFFRHRMERWSLQIPIVGQIQHKAAIARYARTMATLFAAGVPILEALDSVGRAAGNILYETAILGMREPISGGQHLQTAMTQAKIFPNMATQMIAIGEESGQLDTMCLKVAEYYEAEVDGLVENLSTLLEPLIIVVLGIIIGGLVLAMYLPIFNLNNAV